MSKEISVILAKAGWCGHCQEFEPIFEETKKNYKNDKFLSKHNVNFLDYDMATKEGKNNFTISHIGALNMVDAYPTVLVNIYDKEKKNSKYYSISHTVADNNIDDNSEKKKEASERFLTNINNLIKSIDSDGKVLYVQTGGFDKSNYQTSMEESNYRDKYLKYKTKYSELKNKNLYGRI